MNGIGQVEKKILSSEESQMQFPTTIAVDFSTLGKF